MDKNRGSAYFRELTNLGILMEEVGELSRLMVRQYGEQSFKRKWSGKNSVMKWPMCYGCWFAWPTVKPA